MAAGYLARRGRGRHGHGPWIALPDGAAGADRLRRVGGRIAGQKPRLHSTARNAISLWTLGRRNRASASVVKTRCGRVYAAPGWLARRRTARPSGSKVAGGAGGGPPRAAVVVVGGGGGLPVVWVVWLRARGRGVW